jgi:ribonuclease HII
MIPGPDLSYERKLWPAYQFIAGMDEAGRGALAGPVCVGAVILPGDDPALLRTLSGVHDSKLLTSRRREELVPLIKQTVLSWGVGFATAQEIDTLGIVPANRLAAGRAIEMLSCFPQYLLTDFRLELPELDVSQTALVKGDQKSLSIATASILAKTARDQHMRERDQEFPEYGFSRHKGYGTSFHRMRTLALGFSPIHRKTFKVKESGHF